MTGRWADVAGSDGTVRQIWVPADQPPSPDGTVGEWHVVEDEPGQPTRWEWHLAEPTLQGVPVAAPREVDPAGIDRAALGVGIVWAVFLVALPGVLWPVEAAWSNGRDHGVGGAGLGFALLVALLVAGYVLVAAGVARVLGSVLRGPRPTTLNPNPSPESAVGT